jgi:hypothetical protein
MAPFVGGPVARAVETTPLSAALLEARMVGVLQGVSGVYVWIGEKSHAEYAAGARAWAQQLVKFEHAPPPIEVLQGDEPAPFWEMLGGQGPVAARLPAYDKDYGVGTVPTIPPPKVQVSMPSIGAPMSIAGMGGVGGLGRASDGSETARGGETTRLVPGIHTTADDDDVAPLPSARGGRPPLAGLGALSAVPPAAPAAEPPPTPRGGVTSFADLPRVSDPMPTPRGGRPDPLPGRDPLPPVSAAVPPLATPRGRSNPDEAAAERELASKKARDEEEGEEEEEGGGGGGRAELYAAPGPSGSAEWEDLSMFDTDDLDENGAFLLVVYDGGGGARSAHFWVGGESPLSYERDSDIVEVAHGFLAGKGHTELPISLVFQGEEPDTFWEHFVNG